MARSVALAIAILFVWSLMNRADAQRRNPEAAPEHYTLLGPAMPAAGNFMPSSIKTAALPPSSMESAAEARIEAHLLLPTAMNFVEESLDGVIARLAESQDLDIQIDRKALADAAVDYETRITFNRRGLLPLGVGIDLMLDDLALSYVVDHGILRITSRERAEEMLVTRVYPVEDLVVRHDLNPAVRHGANFGPLIELIEDTIDPDFWDTNSGNGSIKPFTGPSGCVLVISNTRKTQLKIAGLLADLRAVKQASRVTIINDPPAAP